MKSRRWEACMMRRMISLVSASFLVAMLAGCSRGPVQTPDFVASIEASAPAPTPASETTAESALPTPEAAAFALHLEAFEDGGVIPDRYTCRGSNESPAVSWTGVPPGAQALVLVVYDADAGAELGAGNDLGFLHWMVYDLAPTSAGLPLGASGQAESLAGGRETANDFSGAAGQPFPGGALIRGVGYDGPCPPARHTYVFRLLALDERLGFPGGTPYQSVLSAFEGRTVAIADWTGIYPPPE
jgi:Raf kinase inhibitor-like YbhB/YbcL family protein